MTQLSSLVYTSPRAIFWQFISFAGVGVIGTLVHYITLITLVRIARASAIPASVAGFVLGGLVNYVFNYHYTFRSNCRHHKTAIKFFTVALGGLILNTLIMTLATTVFALHYLLAQVVATGLVLNWNFFACFFWTFREGRHDRTNE